MYKRPNRSKTSTPPKKKNVEPTSQNPRALRDERNRVRYITVGFRVSPEQNEKINAAVEISGLSKQEYCYRRCLGQDVVVQGNPRVFKGLKDQLERIMTELQRLNSANDVCPETLETINLIAHVLGEMK